MKTILLKLWKNIEDFLNDSEALDEPKYDPVHIALAILLVLLGMAILFWIFWTLLVYEQGIFPKIIPGLMVIFTKKTAADYGYEGYPYEQGIFTGWIGNLGALIFLILLLWAVASLFQSLKVSEERR